MKILIACYSRTGHTARLAQDIGHELKQRGHEVAFEKIIACTERNKWRLTLPLLSTLPVLPAFLLLPAFRNWWYKHYHQEEQAIMPLAYPDVSQFDRICIGGPKWLYIAYPLARYVREVQGLEGKTISAFATFCGPPLKIFELDMLFHPLRQRISQKRGVLVSTMAVSSRHHPFFFFNEMEYVFRMLSRIRFGHSLRCFTFGSAWAQDELQRFCFEFLAERDQQPGKNHMLEIIGNQRGGGA